MHTVFTVLLRPQQADKLSDPVALWNPVLAWWIHWDQSNPDQVQSDDQFVEYTINTGVRVQEQVSRKLQDTLKKIIWTLLRYFQFQNIK